MVGMAIGAVTGTLFTTWFTVNGLSIPGMEEMAATFNLPARIYPEVTFRTAIAGPLIVLAFTLLAAVYPSLRLHRLHPVEAMRVN